MTSPKRNLCLCVVAAEVELFTFAAIITVQLRKSNLNTVSSAMTMTTVNMIINL